MTGMATVYWLNNPGSVPGKGRHVPFLYNVKTVFGTSTLFPSSGYRGLSPAVKVAGA
jgi:hypothetical protein